MAASSAEVILRAEGVSRSFSTATGSITPLIDVTLSVARGEFVSIIGASGVGKSTLLHILGGIDRPTTGSVVIGGTDLSTLLDNELTIFRRSETGFVFQHFNLIPILDVYENVALPFIISGHATQAHRDRVDDLIELFGLRGRERRSITEISSGEQQRIAIARAFLPEPTIVIADEPTGSLDTMTGSEILQLVWESCDNFGQTILLATHHPKIAAIADRVLFLHEGRIASELTLGRREDHSDAGPVVRRLEELGI